jgi:hypothetical protein
MSLVAWAVKQVRFAEVAQQVYEQRKEDFVQRLKGE